MHRRRELLLVLHEAREVVMARRISMQRAAAYWAKVTGAPRPHRGTLVRWATRGVRGRRLRAELLGGRWFTSEAEVDEFLRHVTQVPESCCDQSAGPVRHEQVQAALTDLDQRIAPGSSSRRKAK
jgi:hypothetical protein